MLQIGTQVVYGIHGVCRIIDLEVRRIDRKKVEYFVLEPNDQPGARFLVPSQSPAALAKLRPLITVEELDALFASVVDFDEYWVADENHRKHRYRELINNGDRVALIAMIRCLYKHKEEQLAAGRKFHISDENFLRDAQKLLTSEFSLVLGIPYEQVEAYIQA